ncbi:MAG: hypothetical protein EU535_03070 [Promethearchaeota archaeon]|nr:MAG: hypothetical protein EU535_03070 [Candidatus Lokiarchaeota archaeon]
MRYIFKVLTLGDSNLSLPMIKSGKLTHQFQDHEISRWSKTLNVGTDQAVIEIDAVLSSTIDFDSIIPTSDGILYFLDPNDVQQFELFEMIIEIIQKMGRTIPIILVFYTRKGFLFTPSNFLLEYIWENFLIEAFVFDLYSKNTFYEVLECLSEAMITGNIPINVETTWMRIPYFKDKINRLLKDERYEDAGNLAEILTNMKKKFEKQDYYITAEQASWLYYKSGLYLNASNVLQEVSKKFSDKFIRIYVENLIHQGSRLYNMKRFHSAAEKFEKAFLYASIELNEPTLADQALKLAITTWIVATQFRNAFQLLDKLNIEEGKKLLRELTPTIAEAIDNLVQNKKYDMVKAYLYFIIDNFQRMGLFDEIKILGEKIVTVLKILMHQYIAENNPDQAQITLDELFSIWETFSIEREDMDDEIRSMAILFLNTNQFSIVDKLINYVQSYSIQKELTELRQQAEEQFRREKKDEQYANFSNAISVLKSYINDEIDMFTVSNSEFYKYIEQLKKEGKILEATSEFKKRASWFKNVGHLDIFNEILIHLLGLYIDSDMFLPFLQELVNLRNEERTNYLKRSTGKIQNRIESLIKSEESLDKIDQILDNFARIYRNHLLYDENKTIERLHVDFKIGRAKKLLTTSKGLDECTTVLDLLKQADMVYQRLSEKGPLNYDAVLEDVVNRYLEQIGEKLKEKRTLKEHGGEQKQEDFLQKEISRDLSETNRINEKIKDTRSRAKFHKRIAEIESEISKDREREKITNERIHIMVEKLSRLKQMGKEELMRQQDNLSSRQGLKRIHYHDILTQLSNNEYEKALQGYEKRVESLFSQRKFDLAEIDFAVIVMNLFKLNQKDRLISFRKKFNKSNGIVSQIIDFIITLIDYPDQSIHLQAVRLFENLALFDEEKNLLHQLVKLSTSVKPEESEDLPANVIHEGRVNIVLINKNIEKIRAKESNSAKREEMVRKYWNDAINYIKAQNYSDAAREYLGKIELLVTNNHEEFFPVSLVMGILCLIKASKSQEAKRNLEKVILEVNLPQDIIQNLPEKILLELLLFAQQSQDEEKSDLIYEAFYNYLPLLAHEKGLIFNFLSPSTRTKIKEEEFNISSEKSQSTVLQNQQLANLNRRASEEREKYKESFSRRNALRRMVYKKILDMVANADYVNASKEYFTLAIKQTTKRDYETASVLVLLGSMCLFKCNSQIQSIQAYLNDYMGRIGFSKNVLSETFAVKLLNLLLEAKTIGNSAIFDSTWKLLQVISIFEEETPLFEK